MSAKDPARLMRFVLEMRQEGVTHARVLSAMERTPREAYAPTHLDGLAYEDVALPLAHGQAMTKPSIIGHMLAALDPQADDAVLEVGTGSGYQSAVLAALSKKVVTLDRQRGLIADARARFGASRLMHVFAHVADGAEGWAEDAPFDRIIVNANVAEFPPALIAQLKPGGVMVAPVNERLVRLRNEAREDLGPLKMPPLERGVPDEAPGV